MSNSHNPLDPEKHGKSKSRLQDMILEEVSHQLLNRPSATDLARPGGSKENSSDHSALPPLIVVGNVQHLSLGANHPPAVLGTDVHDQPQHAVYFSGSRHVSITGGISRSIHQCEQGHGEHNAGRGTFPRNQDRVNTDRVGDGSITVVDGEVHNPTAHLQALRYFEGAHHFSIAGSAVMSSHQPVTHAPGEEPAIPTPPVRDEELPNQPDIFTAGQPANASAVPSVPGSPAPPAESAQKERTPPAKQSSPLNLVTPSPYRPCWEHAAADSLLRTGSDVGLGPSGADVDSPSPSPRPSESISHPQSGREGKGKYRLRAAGRSWLFGRRAKKRKSFDGQEEW